MPSEPRALVSPHYSAEKLAAPSFDDLVDVFEDRVRHWLLEPAKALAEGPVSRVPAFALLLSYFEGAWVYETGSDSKGQSRKYFLESFVEVFRGSGTSEELLRRIACVLYEDARCGFFHDGLFRDRIFFGTELSGPLSVTLPRTSGEIDLTGEIQSIVVDPREFYLYVQGHFEQFVKRLRAGEDSAARERFARACKLKWDCDGEPRVIVT